MRKSVIFPLLAVTACGAADPWAGTSPLDADPAGLRAAVELPDGVAVPDSGAQLRMMASRADLGEAVEGVFALTSASHGTREVFRVADADIAEARRLQAQIRGWEQSAPEATSGTYSVSLAACRIGTGPAPDATISVWMSPVADAPLVPLGQDVPVSEALAQGALMDLCS
jgi:hypothetical protein